MSNPSPPTQQPVEQAPAKSQSLTDVIKSSLSDFLSSPTAISYGIFALVLILVPMVGAAKLSHDRYGSIGWATLAFIFSPLYYVYYAYFVSTKVVQQPVPILGGRRRR